MTHLERAMRKRADHFPPFAPYPQTARCGRVLRRPALPQPAEPDALPIDRLNGWVGAIGVCVMVIMWIVEVVAWK